MCFSPEMDLAASVFIGAVAIDTLRHVRRRSDYLLAALPAVFAAHQLIEAFVWWGLKGQVPTAVGDAATDLYLAIAWLMPILVPTAVYLTEPAARRHRIVPFVLVGIVATTALTWSTLDGLVTARIEGHHISYDVALAQPALVVALYVVATCGPMLLSGSRRLRSYGLVNLPVVGLLVWFDRTGLVSLWCLWAALTSIAVDLHIRAGASGAEQGLKSPENSAKGSGTRRRSGSGSGHGR